MDLAVLIKETLRALLLPPGSLLILMIIFFAFRAKKWARNGLIATLCLSWLLASPWFANTLMAQIEAPPLLTPATLANSQAIVILGGGKRFAAYDALEGETVNNVTLARVRYGAKLAKLTKLPVLVSGGSPLGGASEAHYMRQVLEGEFGVPVRWVEGGSVDTAENASASAALLGEQIKTITLVTSADHMPRAARSFRAQGFNVISAPTDYLNREPASIASLLPKASALQTSSTALRELLGQLWYALRGN